MIRPAKTDDFNPFDGMVFLHGMTTHTTYSDDAVVIAVADHRKGMLFLDSLVGVVLQRLHGLAAATGRIFARLDDLDHAAAFVATVDGKLFRHNTLHQKNG